MRYKTRKNNKGFIALMSAIIISFVLIVITVTIGMTSFFGRVNVLDTELKERSSALAEACVDTAILKLSTNQDYLLVPADHSITVTGSDTCDIFSLSPTPPRTFPITIKTQAKINNKVYTNFVIIIDSDYNIVSWDEIPTL